MRTTVWMELRKTTILPTDEKALAQRMLRHLIHEQAHVLLVVLGKGHEAETLVQRADRLSGLPGEPRWVCWARKPDHIRAVVDELRDDGGKLEDLAALRGFALALTDRVRDTFPREEEVPSLVRVLLAFMRAEKPEAS